MGLTNADRRPLPGPPDRDGHLVLAGAPGEKHVRRGSQEGADSAGSTAGRPLQVFAQLSDAHVVEAMVQAVNHCPSGPVTGAALDFAIVTGDSTGGSTESAQLTELQAPWYAVYGDHDNLSRSDHIRAHLACDGRPPGHGYQPANLSSGTCYYAFDIGDRVRNIVLDTVTPHGGYQGSLDEQQCAWLEAQLAQARDRIVVVFSHHPLEAMANDRAPAATRRVLGPELRDLLLRHSCVTLWVNGHARKHTVTPVVNTSGSTGFWEVTTAGHIDRPHQSRIIELIEASDGSISIACTIIDSAAPDRRSAAAGEPGAGGPLDRNVILTVPPSPGRSNPSGVPDYLPRAELVVDGLLTIVREMEDLPYGLEPVSQQAHALQCATLAVDAGASDELIAAALLHDIGYSPRVRLAAPRRSHERASAYYLQSRLGDEVARLVAHHVAAKRYLVAVDRGYLQQLSPASLLSLQRQGGAASSQEIVAWSAKGWLPAAVQLRRWDDHAKMPGATTLPLQWFRVVLLRLAEEAAAGPRTVPKGSRLVTRLG